MASVLIISIVLYGLEFLSRISILTRDIDIANLSVPLSVTFRYQFFQHMVAQSF